MQSWYNNIVTALFWTLSQYCYHRFVSELLGQPCITSLVCPSSSFQVVNSLFKLVDDLGQVVRTQLQLLIFTCEPYYTSPILVSHFHNLPPVVAVGHSYFAVAHKDSDVVVVHTVVDRGNLAILVVDSAADFVGNHLDDNHYRGQMVYL